MSVSKMAATKMAAKEQTDPHGISALGTALFLEVAQVGQ